MIRSPRGGEGIVTPVPNLEKAGGKFAVTVESGFSGDDLQGLIARTEGVGFSPALVNVGLGRQVLMENIRNNTRCIIDDAVLAEEIYQRCKHAIPQVFNGLHAVGLNERLRFLKYEPGEHFAPHCDGCYQRSNEAGEDRSDECSLITLQLYLNGGFEGGATTFLGPFEEPRSAVVPQPGLILLFQHDMLHEGSLLQSGIKYCMRTDVMYTKKGPGREYALRPIGGAVAAVAAAAAAAAAAAEQAEPRTPPTAPRIAADGLLRECLNFNKSRLRAQETRITTRDGRCFVEKKEENGGGRRLEFVGSAEGASLDYLEGSGTGVSRLAPGWFDCDANRWVRTTESAVGGAVRAPPAVSDEFPLRFVTYNTWFSEKDFEERASALFTVLSNSRADVICLQEVTPRLVELLKAESWVRRRYRLSDITGNSCYPYGVAMMIAHERVALDSVEMHSLPSNMGRRALFAHFRIPVASFSSANSSSSSENAAAVVTMKAVSVCTVHLESMANAAMRTAQMRTIFPLLRGGGDGDGDTAGFMMGDFNFAPDESENECEIPAAFADCWTACHADGGSREGGATRLTSLRDRAKARATECREGGTNCGRRIDRVIMRRSTGSEEIFYPMRVVRLGLYPGTHPAVVIHRGDAETGDASLSIEPSDHFGLLSEFVSRRRK